MHHIAERITQLSKDWFGALPLLLLFLFRLEVTHYE